MYYTNRLTAMPYANAHVRKFYNGGVALVSYTTSVAVIDSKGWLSIKGLYSMTTRKHIGAFVKEYANISYQTAKDLYEKKMKYNIHTGEVAPI